MESLEASISSVSSNYPSNMSASTTSIIKLYSLLFFDLFLANLVLHLTVERIYVGKEYGEIDRGVFLIRGENVVLCGEVEVS